MATVTVNSRFGPKSVETELTLPQAAAVLAGKERPSDFERSLCDAHRKWGHKLSEGRAKWLLVLAQEHLDAARNPQPVRPAPTSLGADFSGIQALFGRVAGKLKFPRFRLQTGDGRPVVISLAGSNSKHAGSASVTTGEPFGTPGSFYGRIDPDGTTTVRDPGVVALLREFAADPAGVAAAYGKLTGNCCFCKLGLTDERSLHVGYGPVCAGNYGLPWGERPGPDEPASGRQGALAFGDDPATLPDRRDAEAEEHAREKALSLASAGLPPWDAPEQPAAREAAPAASEGPSPGSGLEPLGLERFLFDCGPHLAGYDRLPMVIL